MGRNPRMRCIKMKEADENLALEFNFIAWDRRNWVNR